MNRRKSVTNAIAKKALEIISEDSLAISSFHDASTEFLKHCRIKGLSPYTVKFYDKELKLTGRGFAEIDAPLTNIRNIKTPHIENFVEYLQGLGRAINTINARLRAGRTFFNFCLRKGYVTANPFDGIQQLRKRHEVGAINVQRQRAKNRYARRIPLTERLRRVLRAYMEERGVLDTDALS